MKLRGLSLDARHLDTPALYAERDALRARLDPSTDPDVDFFRRLTGTQQVPSTSMINEAQECLAKLDLNSAQGKINDAFQQRIRHLERREQELEGRELEIRDLKDENKRLQRALDEAPRANAQELEQRTRDLQKENDGLKQELKDADADIEELTNQRNDHASRSLTQGQTERIERDLDRLDSYDGIVPWQNDIIEGLTGILHRIKLDFSGVFRTARQARDERTGRRRRESSRGWLRDVNRRLNSELFESNRLFNFVVFPLAEGTMFSPPQRALFSFGAVPISSRHIVQNAQIEVSAGLSSAG